MVISNIEGKADLAANLNSVLPPRNKLHVIVSFMYTIEIVFIIHISIKKMPIAL